MVSLAKYWLIIFMAWYCQSSLAVQKTLLFQTEQPLELSMTLSITELKNSESDTVYLASTLFYKTDSEDQWDSIQADFRARGNFRRKNCILPPLRIKLKEREVRNTIFDQNKSLKLVVPCRPMDLYNHLIVKEYLCYKMYEYLSPYYFKTRMVNLTLYDKRGANAKAYQLKAFLIEDDDDVSSRFKARILSPRMVNPDMIEDTTAVRQDFFAYMIGNTDWSNRVQHNVKMMQISNSKYITLPYDFDMSGFVGAPYAVPNDKIPIKSVQERYYLGFCREKFLFEIVRNEYLSIEQTLNDLLSENEMEFSQREIKDCMNYLDSFFTILKDDKLFRDNILNKCRRD
jgi:hypothetical protein